MKHKNISQESLSLLHRHLPLLNFDAATDTPSGQFPMADEYLRYYDLHPEDYEPGLRHFLGKHKIKISHGGMFNIACHYWLHPEARGTVFVVHGYFDHVGLYGHLIKDLLVRGFSVLAFDLPGHGLSDGERASVASFDHYVEVFDSLCEEAAALLPKPWHGMGQSTGGAIVLKHLLEEEQGHLAAPGEKKDYTFDQITLFAPLVHPRFWGFNKLVYLFSHRFLTRVGRAFTANSGDQKFVEFIKSKDPLQTRHLPLEWVGAMKRWTEELKSLPPSDFPVNIIQGDKDTTLDWKGNLKILRKKLPNANVFIVPGGQHHLVNETQALRAKIFDWVAKI